VVGNLGLPLDERGRIRCDSYLQVEGHRDVWALGDAAAVPDPSQKYTAPTPPTAQHAIRQGRRVARNIAAELGAGGRVRPFSYRTRGVFVDLGRHQAVASTIGLRWRGFPAWFLARTYHLANMPGTKRKLRLLVDWTVALLFSRDTSELGQLGHPPELERIGEGPGPTATQPEGANGAPRRAPEPKTSA
jgi:NADH dehydrogenase